MKNLKRHLNLSIFGRTFLLMLAALIIAEGIGIVSILTRPPIHNRPISIDELAQRLGAEQVFNSPPSGPPGPPPDASFTRNFPLQGPPPLNGGPMARLTNNDGPPTNAGAELHIYTANTPPIEPEKIDRIASAAMRKRLAMLLQSDENSLRVYIRKRTNFLDSPPPFDNELTEGFVVGRNLGDNSWRVAESVVHFPTPFQKQALILFAAGLLCLLPMAWFFSRALSIPIIKFSQAAKLIGADPHAPPLPIDGPTEMLAAIESFNAMQARLNSLLQERTEMIAAIAHDLRTPLTRLAFRLDDLPSPLNEKVSADIQEMKSMISSALDFIRDRTLSTLRERLDFRLLVESVVDDQVDLGRDVTLADSPSVTLKGDPLALRRAVMNIVDNAIKYGTRARMRLTITQDYCVLDIDDDGLGIDKALHKRVFEPFFRVENSRNRDTGGVGLGLAVVRAVIQDHAGDIQLQNRSPNGLRVTIKLPLAMQ